MFYEDHRIGAVAALGEAEVTSQAIERFARQFDPRALDSASTPLVAPPMLVACLAMRSIVDWRDRQRAEAARGGRDLDEPGVSPGLKDLRWPCPVWAGERLSFTIETISKRETSKPRWGLVGLITRGVKRNGEEAVVFSSLVFAQRRPG